MATARTTIIAATSDDTFPINRSLNIANVSYLNMYNDGSSGVAYKLQLIGDEGIIKNGKGVEFFPHGLIGEKIGITFYEPGSVTVNWTEDSVQGGVLYQNNNLLTGADYSTTTMPIETSALTPGVVYMLCSIRAKANVNIFLKYISCLLSQIPNSSVCIYLNPDIAGTVSYQDLQIPELEEGIIEAPVGGETPNILTGGTLIYDFQGNSFNPGALLSLNRKFEFVLGDQIVLAVNSRTASIDAAGSLGYSKEKLT